MSSNPIPKLVEIQIAEELTDREMAGRLGCSRQLWQMTRSGRIPPGNTVIKCISKNFPELQQDIIYFLSSNADELSKSGDTMPLRMPSEAQERGWKGFCRGLLGRVRETLLKIKAP